MDTLEVPIFYGDDPEEVEPWVSWINDFAYDQGFSDFETRQFAYGFIDGEAHDWYCEELSRSVFRSWADLKLRIFQRFGKSREDTTAALSFQDRMKELRSFRDQWIEEDEAKKQHEEQTLADGLYSYQIPIHVGGFQKNIDPSLEMVLPLAISAEENDLLTETHQKVSQGMDNPQTQRTEISVSLFNGENAGSRDRTTEPYFERGKDLVGDLFEFDNKTLKEEHQQGEETRSEAEMGDCAYQVFDQMFGKKKRIATRNKNGSTQNGSCDSTGLETPCTKPLVWKQFHRARFKGEKKCDYGYVNSMLQLQRSLGEIRFYQFVEAPSTKNKPATKPSSSVLVRSAVKLGKTLQSQYFPMFYQNTFAFGDVNKLLESVDSEEKNGCVDGRANQVWEPGGSLSPKSQLSCLERLAGVRILKLPDTHIETYIGAELLNEMQRRVLKPDWLLCRTLIWGLCGVEKNEADKVVMNKMQESGIKVQMLICATVMDEYFKSGNSTKGLNLLEEKLKLDVEVTFFTFFPEESTSQVRSSSKDIGRGVATDVRFIGEHSEDHLSPFFSYGRFGSPRPPERSFSHLIPFKTALLTFGFSFYESNIIRRIIHRVYMLGLHVDNEQVENRKVQRLPLARWISKSDVLASRAAIQLTMACTEINKDLGQGILHALLNDGYGKVSRTQNGIGELLYWEETVTVRSCYVVICRIFKGLQQPTQAPYRLLQLLSVPAGMEPLGIKQCFSTTYKVLQAETNVSLNTGVNIKLGQEEVIVKWKGLQDWNCTRERHDNMEQQFPQLDLGDKVSFKGGGIDTCG